MISEYTFVLSVACIVLSLLGIGWKLDDIATELKRQRPK
jgi:hypothetical protein